MSEPLYRIASRKKKYYRWVMYPVGREDGKISGFEEIMAYPLQIAGWEDLYFFAYFGPSYGKNRNHWHIVEATCGTGISQGLNRDVAVELAVHKMEYYGHERVVQLIKEAVNEPGHLSPLLVTVPVEEIKQSVVAVLWAAVDDIRKSVKLPSFSISYPMQPIKDVKLISSGTDVQPAGSKTQHVTLTFTLEVKTV